MLRRSIFCDPIGYILSRNYLLNVPLGGATTTVGWETTSHRCLGESICAPSTSNLFYEIKFEGIVIVYIYLVLRDAIAHSLLQGLSVFRHLILMISTFILLLRWRLHNFCLCGSHHIFRIWHRLILKRRLTIGFINYLWRLKCLIIFLA